MARIGIGFKDGKYVPPVTVDGVLITDKTDEKKIIAERQLTKDAIASLPPATTFEEADARIKRIQSINAGSTESLLADAAYSNVRNSGTGKVLENGRTGTITFGPNGSTRTVYDPPQPSQPPQSAATPENKSLPVQPKIPTPTASGAPIVPSSTTPRVAAPTDDNTPASRSTNQTMLDAITQPGGLIAPQPNILDQFASYTYNIAWYALTPQQFNLLSTLPKIDVSQWSLLVQSGGASKQQNATTQQGVNFGQSTPLNGPLTKIATPNRNEYFTLDYYLDDLEIKSQITGANASQVGELSFKVSEPNGITLIPNLNYAIRGLNAATPLAAQFCLVIKFYGWDIDGNLITDPTLNRGLKGLTPSISNAILTRYYPFTITQLDFKIDGKNVVYHIKGLPTQYIKAASTGLGSIPGNWEFTGETLGQVLSGTTNASAENSNITDGRESTTTDAPPAQTGTTVRSAYSAQTVDVNNGIM
jgi:hypothetical protein